MSECLFPGCSRHPMTNGFCIGHKAYSNSSEVKVPKSIPKRSEKMKDEMAIYKPAMIQFLKTHTTCQIGMDGCTKVATCVHHAAGRIGEKLHDQSDWLASCRNCNLAVEILDAEAREKGFKKSRLSKA